ncbi:MAG: DHH family phosphoesterase [bacterium]|nr:DHH family phosphoesterase [bacterium]
MITETELQEIRNLLNKAENPLFLFDDDQDGLCSFLVLWKYTQKGKGMPIKGQLNEAIAEKVIRENADLIIILDKAVIEEDFVMAIKTPIIHIDHHFPLIIKSPHYHYYNPRKENDEDNRPTSYWAYQVTKKDMWIAMIGIIGDWYIPPDLIEDFQKQYPGLILEAKHPGQIMFDTNFGILIRSFIFSLKGKSQDSKQCIKVLTRIESPWEILKQETARGKFVWKHFSEMEKKYQKTLEEAKKVKTKNKILLYTYPSSQDSFTSLISNEIIYRRPEKIVIIGRIKDDKVVMSLRSTKIKLPDIIKKSLEGLTGYGGGHDLACGANVLNEEFGIFIAKFKKLVAEANKK